MSAEHETAYPRLKSDPTKIELAEIYTPTADELAFARQNSSNQLERMTLLIQLKTVQRLGYFLKSSEVPEIIRSHIAKHAYLKGVGKAKLLELELTGSRHRLRKLVKTRLNITSFDSGGMAVIEQAANSAAKTMQELPDIINVIIEELVYQRFELPGFSTL